MKIESLELFAMRILPGSEMNTSLRRVSRVR